MLIKRFYMSENSFIRLKIRLDHLEAAGGRKRPPKINFRGHDIK